MPRAPDSARDEYYCGFFAFQASQADLISCFAAAASLKPASSTFLHGVTGGVYKARERIHRGILIHDY